MSWWRTRSFAAAPPPLARHPPPAAGIVACTQTMSFKRTRAATSTSCAPRSWEGASTAPSHASPRKKQDCAGKAGARTETDRWLGARKLRQTPGLNDAVDRLEGVYFGRRTVRTNCGVLSWIRRSWRYGWNPGATITTVWDPRVT